MLHRNAPLLVQVQGIVDRIRRPDCADAFHAGHGDCPDGSWLDVACNFTLERKLAPPPDAELVGAGPNILERANASLIRGERTLVVAVNNGKPHRWDNDKSTYESLPPECRAMIRAGMYRLVSNMREPFSAAVSDYLYTKANKEPHWMEVPWASLGNRSWTQYLNEVDPKEGLIRNMEAGAMSSAMPLYLANYRASGARRIGVPQLALRIERFKTYADALDAFEEALHFITFNTVSAAKIHEIAVAAAEDQTSSSGGFNSEHGTHDTHSDADRVEMFRTLHEHPKIGPYLCRARAELGYVPASQAGYPCPV